MAEKEYIEREAAIFEFETNGSNFVYGQKACNAIISRLKTIPAADVVEVRRGKWVAGREIGREFVGSRSESVLYDEWGCNCCGLAIRTPYKPIYKYCPNCGAKMDGGADDA